MNIEFLVPIITSIIGAGATLLTLKYKHTLETKKKCIVEESIKNDSILITKINEILDISGGDRVGIYQFHNGGEYYTGRSMQKLSMTYELSNPGISKIQLERQNIPTSACHPTLDPLVKNKISSYPNVSDMKDSIYKYYSIESGAKSLYQWTIQDLQDRVIGYLQIDFINRKRTLSDELIEIIKEESLLLSGYL